MADLTNRNIRVINSPNQLKLHAHADLGSKVVAYLPNGTLLKIKGTQREFYSVAVLTGDDDGKFGFVWKDKTLDGDFKVELVSEKPAVIEQPARPFPFVPVTLGGVAVLLFLMWLAW